MKIGATQLSQWKPCVRKITPFSKKKGRVTFPDSLLRGSNYILISNQNLLSSRYVLPINLMARLLHWKDLYSFLDSAMGNIKNRLRWKLLSSLTLFLHTQPAVFDHSPPLSLYWLWLQSIP